MYCKNCGEKIKEGAQFCGNCGSELSINNNNSPVNQNQVNNMATYKKENNKSSTGLILSIFGFFTCGICSIIGLVYSIEGLSESKKNGKQDATAILGIIISAIPLMIIVFGVMISLATSKEIEVIDFSSKTKEEAQKWCEKKEANCSIEEKYSDTVPSEGLIKQSENPGTKVRDYTTITITYSKGAKPKSTTKSKETNIPKNEESPDEYKATCQNFDYKEIARQPDTYKNSRAHFRGKVIQVSEHTFDSNKIDLRVDVTEGEYGLWDDTIYVTYKYKDGESKILEDDIVNIYGTLEGTESYVSVLGAKITIPLLEAKYIDLEQ